MISPPTQEMDRLPSPYIRPQSNSPPRVYSPVRLIATDQKQLTLVFFVNRLLDD